MIINFKEIAKASVYNTESSEEALLLQKLLIRFLKEEGLKEQGNIGLSGTSLSLSEQARDCLSEIEKYTGQIFQLKTAEDIPKLIKLLAYLKKHPQKKQGQKDTEVTPQKTGIEHIEITPQKMGIEHLEKQFELEEAIVKKISTNQENLINLLSQPKTTYIITNSRVEIDSLPKKYSNGYIAFSFRDNSEAEKFRNDFFTNKKLIHTYTSSFTRNGNPEKITCFAVPLSYHELRALLTDKKEQIKENGELLQLESTLQQYQQYQEQFVYDTGLISLLSEAAKNHVKIDYKGLMNAVKHCYSPQEDILFDMSGLTACLLVCHQCKISSTEFLQPLIDSAWKKYSNEFRVNAFLITLFNIGRELCSEKEIKEILKHIGEINGEVKMLDAVDFEKLDLTSIPRPNRELFFNTFEDSYKKQSVKVWENISIAFKGSDFIEKKILLDDYLDANTRKDLFAICAADISLANRELLFNTFENDYKKQPADVWLNLLLAFEGSDFLEKKILSADYLDPNTRKNLFIKCATERKFYAIFRRIFDRGYSDNCLKEKHVFFEIIKSENRIYYEQYFGQYLRAHLPSCENNKTEILTLFKAFPYDVSNFFRSRPTFCKDLRTDEAFILDAVKIGNTHAYELIDATLLGNRDFALKIIKECPYFLAYFEKFQTDKNFVLEAVKREGHTLQYAAEQLRQDSDIIKAATQQNPMALQYVILDEGITLEQRFAFILPLAKRNGMALHYVEKSLLKMDLEEKNSTMILAAIQNNGLAFEFIAPLLSGYRDNKQMMQIYKTLLFEALLQLKMLNIPQKNKESSIAFFPPETTTDSQKHECSSEEIDSLLLNYINEKGPDYYIFSRLKLSSYINDFKKACQASSLPKPSH